MDAPREKLNRESREAGDKINKQRGSPKHVDTEFAVPSDTQKTVSLQESVIMYTKILPYRARYAASNEDLCKQTGSTDFKTVYTTDLRQSSGVNGPVRLRPAKPAPPAPLPQG